MLGALGVVFGDIGTSPLYALHAVFGAGHGVQPVRADVYGVISLVFWTITLVVTVKYVTFVMRADNDGEGGIMALLALIMRTSRRTRAQAAIIVVGLVGAGLFYGDGMVTPAIAVLAAVEGLEVAAPSLGSVVVPAALAVLTLLFAIQRFGSGAAGRLFGPIMGVWFIAIALCGLSKVVQHPGIRQALSPAHGVVFLGDNVATGFVALASVALTVTGAEALYADIGHLGRSPIRRAWMLIVFPALVLNYMGQGVVIVHTPSAVENPFFVLVPEWGRMPMVVLATAATVIASQAVISGAFSITHQAVQLGFLPRLTVRHTSEREAGQVYVPAVNWALCVLVIVLVVAFGSSTRLAGAYGVAVTATMAITTVLFLFVARTRWRTPLALVIAGGTAFMTVDLALFSATLTKVPHGGWLHRSVVVVLLEASNAPYVDASDRVTVDALGYRDDGIIHVTARFGFREHQDVPAVLALAARHRPERSLDLDRTSYFLSRISIVRTSAPGLSAWRKRLFVAMWRNQTDPAGYFDLPEEQTVTIGALVEL